MIFQDNIVELAARNDNFRQVVATGDHSQVVLMSIPPGGDIGEEVHERVDQTLIFVLGQGRATLNGVSSVVGANSLCFVPAGTRHNFTNTGTGPLKLYTIYAPAQHKAGAGFKTKADAEAAEQH
jgi:mannose-6-phosphate isomerase-like protein (cupin superfamily)